MSDRSFLIESLGASGDGKAAGASEVFIPFTLPGEEVLLSPSGKLTIVKASPDRAAAPCPYFTRCGGCRLQHLRPSDYTAFKRESVLKTLAQRGINAPVEETVRIPPGTRRRAEFAFNAEKKAFGFHYLKSHSILSVRECLLLAPELAELLPVLCKFPWKGYGSVLVTLCANGADVSVTSSCRKLDLEIRESAAELIQTTSVARISWNKELILEREPLYLSFAGKPVRFPSGAFLQPSVAGEAALLNLVKSALPEGSAKIADLFCGLGTFTLPLDATGYDSAGAAVKSLQAAGGRAFQRDLFREPLAAADLNEFEAAVLAPPRAGAAEQVRELAVSKVPLIVYVSCSPASFARDARILIDSGYLLERVTPVDQFVYSPHTELVAVFRRENA